MEEQTLVLLNINASILSHKVSTVDSLNLAQFTTFAGVGPRADRKPKTVPHRPWTPLPPHSVSLLPSSLAPLSLSCSLQSAAYTVQLPMHIYITIMHNGRTIKHCRTHIHVHKCTYMHSHTHTYSHTHTFMP